MKTGTLVQAIAGHVAARLNCIESGNTEWEERHEDCVIKLVERYLPSGGGFDNGTKIDFELSTGERLVFHTSYHHMDEMGGYDGWTEHTVTATPSFIFDVSLKIGGRNRNDIKEYIADAFHCLHELIDE